MGNLNLLFWLSLIPFATDFMGANHFAPVPTAVYGFNLIMCAGAYTILVRSLLRVHGHDSAFARALGHDLKGWISLASYLAAIPLTLVSEWIGVALYVFVAAIWLIPDRRFSSPAEPAEK